MDALGWIHVIFGLVALAAGTAVVLSAKGTRWHRTFGHVYLTTMLGLNITAFFIYNLFGVFGPFHWMALASLITLAAGMTAVLMRRPRKRWLIWHSGLMTGSYVGLVAAAASEVTSRIPGGGTGFSAAATAVTSVVIISAGVFLIVRYLPRTLGRVGVSSR